MKRNSLHLWLELDFSQLLVNGSGPIPDLFHPKSFLLWFQVRLKAAPALVLLLLALLRLSGLLDSCAPLAAYSYGALSGWVYLRFYQRHSRGRGDMSDHFAFASFFPEAVQPAVGLLAGLVHAALVKIKVCRKMVKRYDVGAPSSITISLPGTDPQDAERRR